MPIVYFFGFYRNTKALLRMWLRQWKDHHQRTWSSDIQQSVVPSSEAVSEVYRNFGLSGLQKAKRPGPVTKTRVYWALLIGHLTDVFLRVGSSVATRLQMCCRVWDQGASKNLTSGYLFTLLRSETLTNVLRGVMTLIHCTITDIPWV